MCAEGDSFSAAFSAFLTDPDSPRQANAASLVAPAPPVPQPHSQRAAGSGVMSTARYLVKYVAGSDAAPVAPAEQRSQLAANAALPV